GSASPASCRGIVTRRTGSPANCVAYSTMRTGSEHWRCATGSKRKTACVRRAIRWRGSWPFRQRPPQRPVAFSGFNVSPTAAAGKLGRQAVDSRFPKENDMVRWAVIFLVIAIIAAVFGFGGIAGDAAWIAKILLVVFVILFVISLILGRGRPSGI